MLEDMRADLLEWPRANWEGRSATVITQFTRGGTRQAVVLSGRSAEPDPKPRSPPRSGKGRPQIEIKLQQLSKR